MLVSLQFDGGDKVFTEPCTQGISYSEVTKILTYGSDWFHHQCIENASEYTGLNLIYCIIVLDASGHA